MYRAVGQICHNYRRGLKVHEILCCQTNTATNICCWKQYHRWKQYYLYGIFELVVLKPADTILSSFSFSPAKAALFCASDSMGQRQDSLKQLTELVHKGEKKGLFSNKMPARIQQVVREENLLFMRNRNVYDADYFAFVRELCSKNMVRNRHCLAV